MDAHPFIAILAARFPAAFTTPRPLAIGVHDAIVASGALDTKACRRALGAWCKSRRYMMTLAKGGDRINLDGNVAGVVTDAQVTAARHELARRKARKAAKKAAQRAREAQAKAKSLAAPKASPGASLASLKAAAQARREAAR